MLLANFALHNDDKIKFYKEIKKIINKKERIMSMETYIFTKKEKIPTTKELQEAITIAGFDYTIADGLDTTSDEFKFWMGSFEGLESGCDYVVDVYNEDDWNFEDKDKAKIGDVDSVITLGTFSNAQEIVAMMIISSLLSQITGGVMISDFFSEDIIDSSETLKMAKEIVEDSREQFKGASTMREGVLNYEGDLENDLSFDVDSLTKELQSKIDKEFDNIKNGLSNTDGYTTGKAFAVEVREAIQGAGIELEDSLDLAFYLYFKNEESALKCADELEPLGLKRHTEQNDYYNEQWLCYSAKNMIPTEKELTTIGSKMLELASLYNGNFDGWETVPEYGFNPFANELSDEQCKDMAQNILEDIKKTTTPPHTYITADINKFEYLDLEGYNSNQQEFENMGYILLGDIENKTISDIGQIVTFSRVMYHPQNRSVCLFYYFDMMGIFFVEFISELEDGKLVITTDAISSGGVEPDTLDVKYVEFMTNNELYNEHQIRVKSYNLSTIEIDSIDKVIAVENEAISRKYKKLKSIGWITKEQLLHFSGGEEELTDCVYSALQNILKEQ